MHFPKEQATNNTAEYEGLLAGLRIATDLGIKQLIVRGDSQLVVRQVNKNYQSPLMEAYVDEVRKLEERFVGLQMEHVPRAQNDIADGLSKCTAFKLPVEPGIFVLKLTQPSVTQSTGQSKKRKLVSSDYLPAELPKPPPRRSPRSTPRVLRSSLLRQAPGFVPSKQALPTSFAPQACRETSSSG